MKKIIYSLTLPLIINTLSASEVSQHEPPREELTTPQYLELSANRRAEDPATKTKAQLQFTVFQNKNPRQFYGTSDITKKEQEVILSEIKTAMYYKELDRLVFDEEAANIVGQILFTNVDRLQAFTIEMIKNGYEKSALAGMSKIEDHFWQDEHATFRSFYHILQTIIGTYIALPKSNRSAQDSVFSKMLLTHFFDKATTDDLETYREKINSLIGGFNQIGFTSSANVLIYFNNTLQMLPTPLTMAQHVMILNCAMEDPKIIRNFDIFLQFVTNIFFDSSTSKAKTAEQIAATLEEMLLCRDAMKKAAAEQADRERQEREAAEAARLEAEQQAAADAEAARLAAEQQAAAEEAARFSSGASRS